jgi:hypothetical protein
MRNFFSLSICFAIIFFSAGCSESLSKAVTLDVLLTALDEAEIKYEKITESQSAYELERAGTERHLYQLDKGKMTIYIFSTVEQRREVQRDPFPVASVMPPNGSYGMGKLLIFYYEGTTTITDRLAEAFERYDAEVGIELQ